MKSAIDKLISCTNNLSTKVAVPAVSAATAAKALDTTNNLHSGIKFVIDPVNAFTREGLHDMKNGFNNSISHIAATSSNNSLKAAVQGNLIYQPSFQDGFYFSLLKNSSNPSSFANMLCSISV